LRYSQTHLIAYRRLRYSQTHLFAPSYIRLKNSSTHLELRYSCRIIYCFIPPCTLPINPISPLRNTSLALLMLLSSRCFCDSSYSSTSHGILMLLSFGTCSSLYSSTNYGTLSFQTSEITYFCILVRRESRAIDVLNTGFCSLSCSSRRLLIFLHQPWNLDASELWDLRLLIFLHQPWNLDASELSLLLRLLIFLQ
jgi:hypothetical protein